MRDTLLISLKRFGMIICEESYYLRKELLMVAIWLVLSIQGKCKSPARSHCFSSPINFGLLLPVTQNIQVVGHYVEKAEVGNESCIREFRMTQPSMTMKSRNSILKVYINRN